MLVHDAARPLVDDDVIGRVLAPLAEGCDGVVPALPLADTVKRVEGDVVTETLARTELVAVQTPQAFVADSASRRASTGDVSDATDCASLVEAARRPRHGRGGRPAAAQGDDAGRPRARRRRGSERRSSSTSARRSSTRPALWERAADAAGVPRFTLMGVLGGLAARGEHHRRVWRAARRRAAGVRRGVRPTTLSRRAALPRRAARSRASGVGRRRQHAGRGRGVAARARRRRRLVRRAGASEKPAPRVLRADRRRGRRSQPAEIAYVGDRVDNDVVPALAAGMVAVHVRRGPWGYLHEPPPAAIRVGSLAELPEALAACLSCGSASASTRTRSPTACRSCSAASRSSIRAGSPATRTAT